MHQIERHGDGSKWGVSDWYEDLESEIVACLAKGKDFSWTTGWYASKKEVQSACITCEGGTITCEALCSDDLDQEGRASRTFPFTQDLDVIREALDNAADEAEGDRADTACYLGYAIYGNCKPKGLQQGEWWVETYLFPVGDGCEMDAPPGDNYHKWGWQHEDSKMPPRVRRRLEKWITRHAMGDTKQKQFTCDGWRVKPWG